MTLRRTHLPEIEQYRLENRDPDALTVIRGVLKGAREFTADGLMTSLRDHGDHVEIHVRDGHTNAAKGLEQVLIHRFGLDVDRDEYAIIIPVSELPAGGDGEGNGDERSE
jgi:hypothetical protein